MAVKTHNIYHGNDNVLELKGLVDNDGTYMNAAIVTAKILSLLGVEVVATGYTAQTLTYVAASNGNYRKDVDKGVTDNISEDKYQLEWTASEGGRDFRRLDFLVIGPRRT